ncbi:MAG: hypothetical protein PHD82_06550 [Candidatus Riflebacteria bacterium]|nr:hypothetical protein [Candidatus Riflebacteria bacterium]
MHDKQLKIGPVSFNAVATATAIAASASVPVLPPGEEIFDLMPPQALDYPWLQLAMQAAVTVFAFWVLWLFYCWLTAPVERPARKIVQSPQKQAFRALERLKLSPVWHDRQAKEICESLAAILKIYAHDAYQIGIGASATSDELVESLTRVSTAAEVARKIYELLEFCDQIKFAGAQNAAFSAEDLADRLLWLLRHEGWLK